MLVTTLRVVWIEILPPEEFPARPIVTTLRVVWIEIHIVRRSFQCFYRHHLAGGVD